MSSLEASVTLEDVFAVALAKRVPLAPELTGYLTLEVADGARHSNGEIDPRSVYISEEGTVALVRQPKKDAGPNDAEASLRAILAKLLEASGSATPALAAVTRKRPGDGVPALITELEAALIPVNRAAGKRALARLARAVKRVTLGVGRNASMPSIRGSSPSFTDEATTVRRDNALAADAAPESVPLSREPAPASTRAVEVREASGRSAGTARSTKAMFAGDEVESLLDACGDSSLGDSKPMSHDLKAIGGLEPTPPPPSADAVDALMRDVVGGSAPAPAPSTNDPDGVEALLALADASAPPGNVAPVANVAAVSNVAAKPSTDARAPLPSAPGSSRLPDVEPAPSTARSNALPPARESSRQPLESAAKWSETAPKSRRELPSRGALPPPRAPKTALALLSVLLLVLVASMVALWTWKPSFFTGRRKAPVPTPTASASAPPPARCKAALVVRDAPANAEILLRMGRAPVDVERMPIGARLEFVATAEGYAPRRAVVKAETLWDHGPDGKPRLDVPIQLDPSKVKPGGVDPWPPAEAGSEVGGPGAPGTVHVVSNVRGAEIWLLAGLGPETRIEPVGCDADIDVLLAGPPTLRRHLHVRSEDFAGAPVDAKGSKTVTLSAK